MTTMMKNKMFDTMTSKDRVRTYCNASHGRTLEHARPAQHGKSRHANVHST